MSATAPTNDPIIKLLIAAREQLSKGELREAALLLNQAQQIWPNDARTFMVGAQLAEHANNVEGAFTALRKAIALAPDYSPAKLELALLHSRHGQHTEANKLIETLHRAEPSNVIILGHMVDIGNRSGDYEMSLRALRRGLELMPDNEQFERHLIDTLFTLNQNEEGLKRLDALIAKHPKDEPSVFKRAEFYIRSGKPSMALRDTNTLIEMFPGNSVYAYYSAIANGVTPAHQPPEISSRMFNGLAADYDQHVVRGLRYQLPKIVADKIIARYPTKALSVLDLGCGTGLLGVCLQRLDGFLIGVDVSQAMVDQATRHGWYDRFHVVNMHDALRETPGSIYEVITALDVFIYTGELSETLPNIHRVLLPSGDAYFSCEIAPEDGPDLVLQPNGRYAHKRSHVIELCKQAGFETVETEDLVIRQEAGESVNGFLVTAHKAA